MRTISSVTDIVTYLASERADLSTCGPAAFDVAAEALRSAVHPVWGSDWEQWLYEHNAIIDEAVAHLPEVQS